MTQRNRRTSKKKQQLTYEDIKDLSPEQLEQMGLGSWLKDNAGNLVQTVGGGVMTAAGTILTATGIGAPAGVALAGAGIGMISSGASGFAETAGQKEQMELQEQQIKEQNALSTANTNLQNKLNQNPLVNYVPTRRRGGRLPKYATGGDMEDPSNSEKDIHKLLTTPSKPTTTSVIKEEPLKDFYTYYGNKQKALTKKQVEEIQEIRRIDGVLKNSYGTANATALSSITNQENPLEFYNALVAADKSQENPAKTLQSYVEDGTITPEELQLYLKKGSYFDTSSITGNNESTNANLKDILYGTRSYLNDLGLTEGERAYAQLKDNPKSGYMFRPHGSVTNILEIIKEGKLVGFTNSAGNIVPFDPKLGYDIKNYPQINNDFQYAGTYSEKFKEHQKGPNKNTPFFDASNSPLPEPGAKVEVKPEQFKPEYYNNNSTSTRPTESTVTRFAQGGTINYGGQLHEGPDGGVPVDAQGNPNAQNPVALVEKGEVKYDTGEGNYIFSDQLELSKGKTFAKKAKDIQAKYRMRMSEGVITDPIAKKGYDKEMQDLVKKQEKLRSIVTPQEQPMMRTGGNLPKYGGLTNTPTGTQQLPWTSDQLSAYRRRQNEPRVAQYNQETYGIDPNAFTTKLTPIGEDPILTLAKSQFGKNMINHKIGLKQPPTQQPLTPEQEANTLRGFQESQQRYQDRLQDNEWDKMISEYNSTDLTPMQLDNMKGISGSGKFSTPDKVAHGVEKGTDKNLYQGQTWGETGLQMIPGIASGISNIALARSRKRAAENMTKLQAPQIVAQQVNLEPARAGIREQGNVARANTSRGLRGSSATPGQYMSNMIAAETGIQRGVGEGINQLNIQEQTQNAASRQSADTFNAQMQARADEMNYMKEQQMMDAYYNQLAGGIGQIGQGITGALSAKASSSQAANMMQMMQPNYELTIDGNPIWGIGNKIRRTPRKTPGETE